MPQVFITSGTSYTLPADFNPVNNTIECYGGGAGGINANGSNGGGGGAYAKSTNVNVTANSTISINIGVSANSSTWFNATSLANAVSQGPGLACGAQGASFATGGSAAASCGVLKYSGGAGGTGQGGAGTSSGGGGGGAAGPNGAGGNGANGANSAGGGGGGADGGASAIGWNGGNNRFGTGGGAGGLSANPGVNGGGGGGAQYAQGQVGAIEDVYGDGIHGPGGGGAGGGGGFGSGAGNGGNSIFGSGGGGSGDGAVGGAPGNGLIVITYISAPVGGPIGGVTEGRILTLNPPYILQARGIRAAEPPPFRMDWYRQPADLLQRPHSKHLFRPVLMPQREAPNPTPLYKPPWLQIPEFLRRLPPSLDHRQQFPGLKPMDFFALLKQGPQTVTTGVNPITVESVITAEFQTSMLCTAIVTPVPELGGTDDIMRRVKLLIPKGWFNDIATIRDAIMGGIADVAAWSYDLVTYARKQSRVAWATDLWLDIISKDYFRFELPRRVNEGDNIFRSRIQEELIRERVTRAGMIKALEDLTGNAPYIFEPWNTGDAGAWDVGTFAWDVGSCGWGDTILPAQAFINVVPPGAGIAGAPGWDIASGWDSGGTMWGDMSLIAGSITDADIYATINKTRPTGSIMWTQLFPPAVPIPIPPAPTLTPSFAPPSMIPLVVQPGPQRYSIPVMPDVV